MSNKVNVGLLDRILRLGISGILFYLAFFFPPTAQDAMSSYILIAAGVINAVVALIGICPVYMLIGVNTANNKSE
ncbi:MAG: DUF2892 domain-containing protein [Chromatiales bacterium]|nr:DUF2892 domain-containing protein [Chromatiales bacterium]